LSRKFLSLIFWTLSCSVLFAQQQNNQENQSEAPSRTFSSISLGMSYDAVLDALETDTNFIFRGKPDVSMLDPLDRTTIEVRGAGFVHRGFFSFYDDQLFSITIVMNPNYIDYFTLWKTLSDRYGQPTDLNPMRSIWEDDTTRLQLEHPATLKYLDTAIFNELLGRSNTEQSTIDRSRDRFLDGL
jgi:hypothetical protein